MHAKRHAILARRLIKACGGLEEAAANCRLEKSRLADFQSDEDGHFMPADVMADLEGYAGEPIYSAAIANERPAAPRPKSALTEGCETAEMASDLQRIIRLALENDGAIDQAERLKIEGQLLSLEDQLRETRAALDLAGLARAGGEAAS